MPVAALCFNLAWEFYFSFFASIPLASRVGNGLFLLFNTGVLYTCLRYGKEDFNWPIFKEYFYSFMAIMTVVFFVLIHVFVISFNDYGMLVTLFAQLIYSMLFLAMLLRRNSVKGQSLYIGIFILIGDACGYAMTPYTHEFFQPDAPMAWIHTVNIYILSLHLVYIGMYYYVARRDGINPWKRL